MAADHLLYSATIKGRNLGIVKRSKIQGQMQRMCGE